MSAPQIIRRLRLAPHPEGGWYRRVFAETLRVAPADGRPPRPALSCIYYLLEAKQRTRWHRVASAEVWSLLHGGPLELGQFDAARRQFRRTVLARRRGLRAELLGAVPAGVWQAARTPGGYALVACAVAPGFAWEDFAWLDDHPADLAALAQVAPKKWLRPN